MTLLVRVAFFVLVAAVQSLAESESLFIKATGETKTSSILTVGWHYTVMACGTYNWASNGASADAAGYASPSNFKAQHPIPKNLSGGEIDWAGFSSSSNRCYSAVVIGQGQALSFRISDDYYDDNSGGLNVTITELPHCIYSSPDTPAGPSSGGVMETLLFSTLGASCTRSHDVDYRFVWGDGATSTWGSINSASHAWAIPGTYSVTAEARCRLVNSIQAASSSTSVVVQAYPYITVTGPGLVRSATTTNAYICKATYASGETRDVSTSASTTWSVVSPYWIPGFSFVGNRLTAGHLPDGLSVITVQAVYKEDDVFKTNSLAVTVIDDIEIVPDANYRNDGTPGSQKSLFGLFAPGDTVHLPFRITAHQSRSATLMFKVWPTNSHVSVFASSPISVCLINGTVTVDTPQWAIPPDLALGDYVVSACLRDVAMPDVILDTTRPGYADTGYPDDKAKLKSTRQTIHVNKLSLLGIEVTQCVQNWNNSVPLIEGKPTFVRVAIVSGCDQEVPVTATLSALRGNEKLTNGFTVTVCGKGTAEREIRSNGEHIGHIPLHESWWSGDSVEFSVSAPTLVADSGFAGDKDKLAVRVAFRQAPVLKVFMPKVIWWDEEGPHKPDYGYIESSRRYLANMLPVRGVDSISTFEMCYFGVGCPTTFNDFNRILWQLLQCRVFGLSQGFVPSESYHLGVIDPPAKGQIIMGKALDFDSSTACFFVSNGRNYRGPHEFGHLAGRHHTETDKKEASPDKQFPYNTPQKGIISPQMTGNGANWGYDCELERIIKVAADVILEPDTRDVMSWYETRWISDWTYTNIWAFLNSRYNLSPASPLRMQTAMSQQEIAIVAGIVNPDSVTGQLLSVMRLVGTPAEAIAAGSYSLRFEDSSHSILASYSFEPSSTSEDTTTRIFCLRVPCPEATVQIRLFHDGEELASAAMSAHAPWVTVQSPNGGEPVVGNQIAVGWTAGDPDGNALTYTVLFSPDEGSSWRMVAAGLTNNFFNLDAAMISGTSKGVIRVMVSDGFRTADDQSDAPFTVPNQSPAVWIRSPQNGTSVHSEQAMLFSAEADDPEDGHLSATSIVWRLEDGSVLGTGSSFVVSSANIADGTHTASVTVTDSAGSTGTAAVVFTVSHDADLDGLPDAWSLRYFGSPTAADASEDPDGDGIDNRTEYRLGTDPTDAQSPKGYNMVPYSESFENLSGVGVMQVPLFQRLGWVSGMPTQDQSKVVSLGYPFAGVRPIPAATHTSVLQLDTRTLVLTNSFGAGFDMGGGITRIDMMMRFVANDILPGHFTASDSGIKGGIYANEQSRLTIYHGVAAPDGSLLSNKVDTTDIALDTAQWHRVTLTVDATAPNTALFQVKLNGTVVTNGSAFVDGWKSHYIGTGQLPTTSEEGTWFRIATTNTNSRLLTGLCFTGSGYVDDLTVAAAPKTFLLSVVKVGTGNSSLGTEYSSSFDIAEGAETQIVYRAADWHRIAELASNGESVSGAVGVRVYTQEIVSIKADISNSVVFAEALPTQTGYATVPTAWLMNWAEDAVLAGDGDNFSVPTEYALGLSPVSDNAYGLSIESVNVKDGQVVTVVRRSVSGELSPDGMHGTLTLRAAEKLGTAFTNIVSSAVTGAGVFDTEGRRVFTNSVSCPQLFLKVSLE